MAVDPASLDNLRDIVTPTPVSWLPPAAGWPLIAAAGLAAVAVAVWRGGRRWRANAYRREALRELAVVESNWREGGSLAITAATVSALTKRAALVAYPRTEVAELTGPHWLAFLDRTGRMTSFSEGAAKDLWRLACGASSGPSDLDAAFDATRRWLRKHRQDERSR